MSNSQKPWLPSKPPNIILTNAKVADVANATTLENEDVLISSGKFVLNGKIKELGDVIEFDLKDMYFLCPGLIDCPVHLTANAG